MVKLGLFGNIANNFFRLGNILNTDENLDVTLFLPESGDTTNFPEGDQPNAKNIQWSWIDRGKQNQLRNAFKFGKNNLLWRLSQQDVVLISSTNVMLAPFIRRPKVAFCPTGADMNVFPFFRVHLKFYRNSHSAWHTYQPINLFRICIISFATRFGIKSCDFVIENPFAPYMRSAAEMKLSKSKLIKFPPPLAIDTDTFRSRTRDQVTLPAEILSAFEQFDFRIFSPSRILINRDPDYVQIGQYKQNDLLVRAFAKFLSSNPTRRCGLFLIERKNMVENESGEMRNLISQLGIDESVIWLKPTQGDSFDRSSLIDMYSISDVVADDFGVGWFGSASLEALSCSKPLLNYVDASIMSENYPWHPFLSSKDAEEIAEILKELYGNPTKVQEIGANGRRWVQEFHSAEPIKQRYLALIKQMVENRSKI